MLNTVSMLRALVCVVILSVLTARTRGQQIYLTLGSDPNIITDNTEILITDIGEGDDDPPRLTCHTDSPTCCRNADSGGNGGLGQWTYPDGSMVLSSSAGQRFYINRDGPQLIHLNRREGNNPLSPTGSYCCTVPTNGGDMTLCANLVLCPSLSLDNGMVTYNDNTLGQNSMATHTCNPGYTLVGSIVRSCGSDGEWSGTTATCTRICPDLMVVPTNGEPIGYSMTPIMSSRLVGTVATYTCTSGYTLSGDTTRTCGSDGEWSGSAPTCQPVVCSDLSVDNGVVVHGSGSANSRPVNTVATYICTSGYTLSGTMTRTCGSNGEWSESAPTCQAVAMMCSDNLPTISNGDINYTGGSANSRPVGATAIYTCTSSYTLSGVATRTCESTGQWSVAATPMCLLSVCSDLPSLKNGVITYNTESLNNRPVNTVATHTCNNGYTLSREKQRVCVSGGIWSGSIPTCIADSGPTDPPPPITCPHLPPLDNGMINYNNEDSPKPVNTGAIYMCSTGYTLSVPTTRTCGSNGQWSGSAPVCQCICTDLSVDNGAVTYSSGSPNNRPVYTVATYTCTSGYTLSGDTTRTCGSNGLWSGSAPVCQRVCSDLPSLTNGVITYNTGSPNNRPVNTVALHTCNTGYILSGGSSRTCTPDGFWNGSTTTCVDPPPVYLSLSSTNYLSGLPETSLSSVGEGGGLVCRTNLPDCCESEGGNWYHPNGSVVMTEGVLYVRRGDRRISLQLSSGAPPGTGGLYCCEVPTSGGMDTMCIVLTATEKTPPSPPSDCDSTGVVVGAVVVVLVVVVAVTVVLVTYLVLRHKRVGKMSVPQDIPLSDQGQSSAPTYETVPSNYEEIPADIKVKGDCPYTQNEAYQTVSGQDNTTPSSEGIYDN